MISASAISRVFYIADRRLSHPSLILVEPATFRLGVIHSTIFLGPNLGTIPSILVLCLHLAAYTRPLDAQGFRQAYRIVGKVP